MDAGQGDAERGISAASGDKNAPAPASASGATPNWQGEQGERGEHGLRPDIRRGSALRQIWISAGDYVLNILILLLFAWFDIISYSVPAIIFVYGVVANGIYLGAVYSGFSQRFRDPFLTRMGVSFGVCANFLMLYLAPQIGYLFIINLFVPLAFAALRFSRQEFLVSGLLVSLTLGAMFAAGLASVPQMPVGLEESILGWLVISIALARYLMIQTEIARLGAKLRQRNEDLRVVTAKLAEQASRDHLTGLCNRREFMRLLQQEILRSQRTGTSFCVVLIDIDHFKQVNDRFGHPVGDQVLVHISQIYRNSVRESDVCARYGGEEFTVLALSDDLNGVRAMIERLRSNVERYDWSFIEPELRVTVSAGIARWREGESQTDVLRRADDAMYAAKHDGRNCVHVSRTEPNG